MTNPISKNKGVRNVGVSNTTDDPWISIETNPSSKIGQTKTAIIEPKIKQRQTTTI
jgi:hypothetical protein